MVLNILKLSADAAAISATVPSFLSSYIVI